MWTKFQCDISFIRFHHHYYCLKYETLVFFNECFSYSNNTFSYLLQYMYFSKFFTLSLWGHTVPGQNFLKKQGPTFLGIELKVIHKLHISEENIPSSKQNKVNVKILLTINVVHDISLNVQIAVHRSLNTYSVS